MVRVASAAALLAALAVSAIGCGSQPPARTSLDLLQAPLEPRSDRHDLAGLATDPFFDRRGWAPLERGPRGLLAWTLGTRSRLSLPFETTSDKQLRLVARIHESLGPSQTLSLSLNGVALGRLELEPAPREFRLPLPSSAQRVGDNTLEIEAPRQRTPPADDPDQRPLVAAVSELEIRPLGAGGRGAPLVERGRLALPGTSSAAWYVRVERDAALRLRARPGTGAGGRLAVRFAPHAGVRTELWQSPPEEVPAQLALAAPVGTVGRIEVANPGSGLVWLDELALEWAVSPAPPPAPLDGRPNLILYLVDTLRADRLGVYGESAPTSPELDRFAAGALVFDDAWAQASWTRPTTASILTGLHPSAHGAESEDATLVPELTTLAERLSAEGYRTGAFVANHLVGGRFGFDQGFDSWNAGDDALYGAPAVRLGERALEWLDEGEGPFLLYLHTMEPHSPYDPPAETEALFVPEGYDGDRDTRALLRLGQLGRLDESGLRFLEGRYRAEIRENDRAFGALLRGLEERGLLEESVIVFLSDHGEELLDHGGTEHAKTLYQELVRIPLVVRLPGAARSARVAEPVQQIDLMPTLLGLLGVPPPEGVAGRDLSSWWRGGDAPDPPPLLFAEERFTVTDKRAVRAGALKLILNNDGPALWRQGTHLELYDLQSDPTERVNLAGEAPIAEAYLRQELERFRRAQVATARDGAVELTPEEREQLRALGYVE